MTKAEIRKILKTKVIYVVDNGSQAVSKFKFFTIKKNDLIDITRDIAEAGNLKMTKNREIKEAVFGMDRVFNVLYYVYSDIKAKGESNRGSFKYIHMN